MGIGVLSTAAVVIGYGIVTESLAGGFGMPALGPALGGTPAGAAGPAAGGAGVMNLGTTGLLWSRLMGSPGFHGPVANAAQVAPTTGAPTQGGGPTAAGSNKGGIADGVKRPSLFDPEVGAVAEVTARYNQKTGKLTVTDDDTGAKVVADVESGGKPYGDPIPKGDYEILEQQRTGQYRLDAVDAKPRNDVHEPSGRSNFRLHGPGRSIGCIACKDRQSWAKIKELIGQTKTTTVTDKSTPWWKFWESDPPIKKFGKLTVE